MMTIFALGIWQIILIIAVFAIGVLPTLLALIDIVKSDFKGNNQIIWVLVVLFFNFFGAILYFMIGIEQKITQRF